MSRFKNLLILFSVVFIIACQENQNTVNNSMPDFDTQKALVKEVIQTTSYTYLRVLKNNDYQWIAINKQDVAEGAKIYFDDGLKMENFTSLELRRTFETVYFVSAISDKPISHSMPGAITGNQPQKPVISKQDIKIEQPDGAVSIAELYAKRGSFSGKNVKIKGKVTKINMAIMNRNWIHIQDGTADGKNFDLTITTNDEPKSGDIVFYSGTLKLNQDFGMGYSYEILLEDATPIVINESN
jgi:hypothetical protein